MDAILTTDDVPSGQRFDYWHEVICRAFVRLQAELLPGEAPFHATISASSLGPLAVSRVSAMPHAVTRSRAIIAAEPRDEVLLSLQLSGLAVIKQDGREAVLRPGDFTLYDATRPYDLVMPKQFDMLVFQFDRSFLQERCPAPEALTAIRLAGNQPLNATVSTFLRSLEPLAHRDRSSVSPQLATHALDLVALSLADRFGQEHAPGSPRTRHFLRACAFISAHARDPELDPARIAAGSFISLRYLHQLFRERGTTVGRYLIDRRLAGARDDLLDPRFAGRTILDIATSHGFVTSAHFARCFRERYGASPSDLRRGRVAVTR